jgi:translation initiation factor 2B subunit (eIF-2B alpha/beta/delta family)
MADLGDSLRARIDGLGTDRESGASALLRQALAILGAARPLGDGAVLEAARRIWDVQPSMAPLRNAALEAVASFDRPARFERFVQRVEHAPRILARVAGDFFAADAADAGATFRCATISSSSAVRVVIDAVRATRPVEVWCSESRPALEGRALAASLAWAGVIVTCVADAALAHAMPHVDAVLVGADAIAPDRLLNKSGTRMLAAAAVQHGIPVYVAATRDKMVGAAVADTLTIREGDADEIWPAPPPGVTVRNPYFEWIPLDLVAALLTDAGVLGAGMAPAACAAVHDETTSAALARILRA